VVRNNEEETLQKAIVQFLNLKARPEVVWFHVPNGEQRSIRTAVRLKAMGVRKGVPDLIIITHTGPHFLEVKAPKAYQKPEQREFQHKVEYLGNKYVVVKDIDAAISTLTEWGAIW
jgi:hypothetical protein